MDKIWKWFVYYVIDILGSIACGILGWYISKQVIEWLKSK